MQFLFFGELQEWSVITTQQMYWHTRSWKKNILIKWKAWAWVTRDNDSKFFMALCTLSKTFEIIFWEIVCSCFRDSNFLDLNKMWLGLKENYLGDYCMMFTIPMVDAVPTWGKHTDSWLRYQNKYLFELKTAINAITVDIYFFNILLAFSL